MARVADHRSQGAAEQFSENLARVNSAPRAGHRGGVARSRQMLDLILVVAAIAAFAVSIGYAYACDRL